MKNNLNPYEGVENFNRINKKDFFKYCNTKLKSVDKHVKFLKNFSREKNYEGKVLEIGSGNGKLLFRLERENLISEGIGCEISKSRCRFSKKFKKVFGFKKVEIKNMNFFDLKLKKNYFDYIIGIDVVINLIGGIQKKKIFSLIKKCEEALKPNGRLILEFMTFDREKKMIKLNSNKKIFIWKKFNKTDPFIFGLDEMTLLKDKIFWKKCFIPRVSNKLKFFNHAMLPLSKKFFLNKKFKIYNQWSKKDDTDQQEFIAVKKFKKNYEL